MRLRWPLLAATAAGLAAGVWAIGRAGLGDIVDGIAALGWGGFGLLLAASLLVNAVLGAAWFAATPGEPLRRLPLFTWARMTREAASDLLPFSQLGGLAVGARTLITGGVAPRRAYAGMIADMSAEMLAQLILTLFGVWTLGRVLVDPAANATLRPLALGGAAVATGIAFGFIALQRPLLRLAGAMAARVLGGAQVAVEAVLTELAAFHRARGAMLATFALNLTAWIGSTACAWLVLRLVGAPVGFAAVVALESLIFALRSAAFVIPGALGVQEAGYILLAPLFGIDPGTAVALSLVKRGRDLAIGLPVLLVWQAGEIRHGLRRPPAE